MTNPFAKTLLLVSVVLLLPVMILAVWGESFSHTLSQWQDSPPSSTALFAGVVALLAADVFLPIPSGPVSTLAGSHLGLIGGTVASTLGMTLGGLVAFWLARKWGRPLAERLAEPEQMEELTDSCSRHGGWMLLVTRPLPIVAEAALLVSGTLGMSWNRFLPILLASNLILSATYAALGTTASQRGWLPLAVCCSVAVPILGTVAWKRGAKSPGG